MPVQQAHQHRRVQQHQHKPAAKPHAVRPLEPAGVQNVDKQDTALRAAAIKHGAGPDVVKAAKAIMYQESRGKNVPLHADGNGRGMIGLDPRGELPKFEKWAGEKFPPGKTIPEAKQAEYLVKKLNDFKTERGSLDQAIRAWHRPGKPNDAAGDRYSALIKSHMNQWP